MNAEDAKSLSTIIDAIGTDQLGEAIDAALKNIVDFDMSCAFLFRFNHGALLIHNGYNRLVSDRALNTYVRGGYLLDPFYVACINGHPGGLWRMSDLAPDSFFSSGFAISKEIHPCLSSTNGTSIEEIGYIVPIQNKTAIVYSLMRNLSRGAFQEQEMNRLEALAPILNSTFELHCRLKYHDCFSNPQSADAKFEDAFIDILQGQLTETQRYIARLILQGHSTLSIASLLGISEGTVKVHKHNIYQRLNISNNAELFRLFINYLARVS